MIIMIRLWKCLYCKLFIIVYYYCFLNLKHCLIFYYVIMQHLDTSVMQNTWNPLLPIEQKELRD